MKWEAIIRDNEQIQNKLSEMYIILKESIDNNKIGLMGGSLGITIFFSYYNKYIKQESKNNESIEILENVFDSVNNGFSNSKLAGGLSGFVWSVYHLLNEDFLSKDSVTGLIVLKSYLIKEMYSDIENGYYDYLHGALGIAFGLSKFRNNNDINLNLERFLEILESKGIKEKKSIKWKSKITIDENIYCYNLGLSHGIPSIIGVLLSLINSNILVEKSTHIIEKTIEYIIESANYKSSHSVFPNVVITNESILYNSRLAWCYGDLGIGITLWRAGNILKREDVKKIAENILIRSTTRKDLQENFVVDAGLCHGTAGIAHIYNRMYNYTGNPKFKETSLYWFNETLKMAKYNNGLAGFKAWRTPELGGLKNEHGFLEGIAGIGLSLIASISDIEPKWDECLLLS